MREKNEILEIIRRNFPKINQDNIAIYVCSELMQPGNYKLGGTEINIPRVSELVFVDLEPMVNWGHDCFYLAILDEEANIIRFDSQFPPYFNSTESDFNLLYKGQNVPDWTVHGG